MVRFLSVTAAGAVVGAAMLAHPSMGAAEATAAGTGPAGAVQPVAATSCSTPWGSLEESAGTLSTAALTNVRSGQHACFDRVVFDLLGSGEGHHVRYVPAVLAQGSGAVVPLRGGALLQVDLQNPAYDENGRSTYQPADRRELVPVAGYRTLRQAAWGGSYEGYTTVGVGVRARLPFRTFVLPTTGGSKLVLDVAHIW